MADSTLKHESQAQPVTEPNPTHYDNIIDHGRPSAPTQRVNINGRTLNQVHVELAGPSEDLLQGGINKERLGRPQQERLMTVKTEEDRGKTPKDDGESANMLGQASAVQDVDTVASLRKRSMDEDDLGLKTKEVKRARGDKDNKSTMGASEPSLEALDSTRGSKHLKRPWALEQPETPVKKIRIEPTVSKTPSTAPKPLRAATGGQSLFMPRSFVAKAGMAGTKRGHVSPLAAAIGATSMTDLVRMRHEQDGVRHARLPEVSKQAVPADFVTKGKKDAKKPQEKKHMEKMAMKPQDEHRINKMAKKRQDDKMTKKPQDKYIKEAAAQKQVLLSKEWKGIADKNAQDKKPKSDGRTGRVRALMDLDIPNHSTRNRGIVGKDGEAAQKAKAVKEAETTAMAKAVKEKGQRKNKENLRAGVTLDDLLAGVLEHNKYNLPR